MFTFTDTKGWQDLGVVNVPINGGLDAHQACYRAYSRPLNLLYLVNDLGTGLIPGLISFNGSGTLANGQCSLSGSGSSAVATGIPWR